MAEALNSTLQALLSHSSVRDFTPEPVSEEQRLAILEAARAASSSCFLQATTVIRVTDPGKRAAFARLSGNQKHIETAPEFWVFCADYHRDSRMMADPADLGWTEQLIVACTDAAIMAQNAFAALESLGLGGVYAGGIRNGIEEADRLLALPANVFPVVGLAFGHPASKNELKPRLPKEILFCENEYREAGAEELAAYDRVMENYYANRKKNPRKGNWTGDIARILTKERRPFILDYLRKKGFALK